MNNQLLFEVNKKVGYKNKYLVIHLFHHVLSTSVFYNSQSIHSHYFRPAMILSNTSLSQSAITLKLETQKSTLSQIDIKTTNISIKCLQEKDAHSLCMNVNCKQKNAAMCKYQQCLCKETHKSCIYVDINKLVHTIKKQAYPFEKIKTKIINIFDQAIDQLSQTQDQLLLKYQNLFQQGTYTKDQRLLLSALQNNLNNTQIITSQLIYKINANLYNKKQQHQIMEDINNKIDHYTSKFIKKLHQFERDIEKQIILIQKQFTDIKEQQIYGLFKESSIVQKRKDEKTLLGFFSTKVIDAELLYKGTENNFCKGKFNQVYFNNENLLILIKTERNKLIGGFTPLSFSSTLIPQKFQHQQNQQFLFSISQGQKLPYKQKRQSMNLGDHLSKQMFTFNDDLTIGENPYKNYNSFVNLQGCYRNEKFKNNLQGWVKFTGSSIEYFSIVQMEIWTILFKANQESYFKQ